MYIHFIYKDHSNPYITIANKNLFDMICKYYLKQVSADTFEVLGRSTIWSTNPNKKKSAYQKKRFYLEEFAKQWQDDFPNMLYDWLDLVNWHVFFEEYGKKYGLLREFRENGII